MQRLDNIIWHTIREDSRNLSTRSGQVGLFHPDIAPFAGMEQYDEDHFNDLQGLITDDRVVVLFSSEDFRIPKQWNIVQHMIIDQMVYVPTDHTVVKPTQTLVLLSIDHTAQMLDLTYLTKPGPFFPRTILFGEYFGIFDGDKLTAMAGFRFNVKGFIEISAVCTHPDYTGRGYARELLLHLIAKIRKMQATPFLHVRQDNAGAIRVYQQLGFEHRMPVYLYAVKKN